MHIVHTFEEPPEEFSQSLFFAGPTPRTADVLSWRPEALRILAERKYEGVVFVPEFRNWTPLSEKDPEMHRRQTAWEQRMFNMSDCKLFWVPREIALLPGFTTNVEFGLFARFGGIVFGAPHNAAKMEYLKEMTEIFHVPYFKTLAETVDAALKQIGSPVLRKGGEREIPLYLWRHPAFQNWHQAQKNAGHILAGARVEWIARVISKPDIIYAFAIRPDILIPEEQRNKRNEIVIFRKDISSALLYKRAEKFVDTKIVLIKEFRSPSANGSGYIRELPGGSSHHETDAKEVAAEELYEEVGLQIAPSRLKSHGSRQLAGTVLTHKAHLFSAELTDEELAWLETQKGIAHGTNLDNPTGERAYTEIKTLGEIMSENLVDWSNVGMIFQALRER